MRHSAYIQLSPTPLVPVNVLQSYPLMTQSQIYQPLIKVQPPPQQQPQIVRQRPIHVVDLEQYDDIWRKRVEELERQLKELQNQKPLPTPVPEPVIELRAGADTEDLEKQISQLQLDLYKSKEDYEDLLQKYKESLEVQEQLREQIKNHICSDNTGELKKIISQKDAEIERLKAQLEQLKEQIKNHICSDNTGELKKIISQKDIEIERLKAQLAQLANQKPAAPVVIDNSDQLKLLQARIDELEKQLQESILQAERFRQENQQLQTQLQYYKDQNDEKDEIIKDLRRQIEDLNAELDELQGEQEEIIEQRVETIRNEVKTWKDKFLALNVQYHDQQEKLMLTEAELDHIKKQQGAKSGASQVTTTTTTKTTK